MTPRTTPLTPGDRAELLAAFGWSDADLDPRLPPAVAYAGAWHPLIALRARAQLTAMSYDMSRLGALMARRGWTTVQVVWRESRTLFHARNPFPPGGVVEDPATGAAAAALGGYLREHQLVHPPAVLLVRQGDDMGRPSLLHVGIPSKPGSGIDVTGTAAALV